MTPERWVSVAMLLLGWGTPAWGQGAAEIPEPAKAPAAQPDAQPDAQLRIPDASIQRHRTPFEALTERAIGRTSRRVRFDWRRSSTHVGITGGLPAELNNFDSLHAGIFLRVPTGGLLVESAIRYVWVEGSDSTRKLALTPYRQAGRLPRLELDVSAAYPLAEGIVTAVPGFMPATQLVLNGVGHFRYLVYPGSFAGLDLTDTLRAILSPRLTEEELDNLEADRLPGMKIDPGRWIALAGLSLDLYFQTGFLVSTRTLVSLPLLAPATQSEILFGLELNLSLGFAF